MCEDYLNCVSVTEREEPDAGKWLEVQVALNPDGSVTVRNTFDNEPVGAILRCWRLCIKPWSHCTYL